MKAKKACINANCSACQKKTAYKDTDTFCSICGRPLAYVCKDCNTQLPDGDEKYCVRCRAKHEDRAAAVKRNLVNIGGGVIAFAGLSVKYGKKAVDIAKQVIKL